MNQLIIHLVKIKQYQTVVNRTKVTILSTYFTYSIYLHILGSDEHLDTLFIKNNSNSIMPPTRPNTQLSPLSAARSTISICSRNKNDAIPSILPKPNSRIRAERHYGEVITSGILLQDL